MVEGAENRLVAIAETVGFTVNSSPMGSPAGGTENGANGARHAQHSDAPGSPRDFSEVDLTLTKDHWDPLSDARWSQAADIVSLFSN